MGDVQGQIDYPRGLDLERVCTALMNNLENEKEKERIRKEKERNKISDFHDHFDEIKKYILIPTLMDKFDDFGYDFTEAYNPCSIKSKENNISLHINVLLQNEKTAMLVDTKFEFSIDDINKHIDCLVLMRKYADISNNIRNKQRKYLGAIAGIVIADDVKKLALDHGLFVIEPSGETFKITPPKGAPKEW